MFYTSACATGNVSSVVRYSQQVWLTLAVLEFCLNTWRKRLLTEGQIETPAYPHGLDVVGPHFLLLFRKTSVSLTSSEILLIYIII